MVARSGLSFLLCLFSFLNSQLSFCQEIDADVYGVHEVDSPPVFGSGEKDLVKYINKNFQAEDLVADGELNNVFNRLVINEQGKVISVEVLRGGGPEINKRITSFFKEMPSWTPALKDEEPVKVTITLPVVIHGKN